jgi:hypothetical protein
MTDNSRIIGEGAFGPEPARDAALGAALREQVGAVPQDVNWQALAQRISARVAAHAAASPWWAYAARWERRVIPIALVAGIAATLALANLEVASAASPTFVSAASVSTAVVSGTSFEEAALQFAHSVTSVGDITAGTPE